MMRNFSDWGTVPFSKKNRPHFKIRKIHKLKLKIGKILIIKKV